MPNDERQPQKQPNKRNPPSPSIKHKPQACLQYLYHSAERSKMPTNPSNASLPLHL